MIKYIKRIIFGWRYKKAVKNAQNLHEQTGKKYMVIIWNGKPQVAAKSNLRQLIKTKRFRKGIRIADIERMALYITK